MQIPKNMGRAFAVPKRGIKAARQLHRFTRKAHSKFRIKKEDEIIMKKSTFAAILAFIAAATGALVAAWLYILRREKEMMKYQELFFGPDFNDEIVEDEAEVPAEEAEAEEPAAEPEDPSAE